MDTANTRETVSQSLEMRTLRAVVAIAMGRQTGLPATVDRLVEEILRDPGITRLGRLIS